MFVCLACACACVRVVCAKRKSRSVLLTSTIRKAMGVSNFYMFRRHIFPNVLGPIAVYATLTIPQVMLLEAFLSFLGLGIQPPMSSWGTLIRYGVESMEEYWWLLVFPGITFTVTLFSLNFFGDGLRDALDPKTSSD